MVRVRQMSLQSQELHDLYDNYYTEAVAKKRAIAAIQSVDHLEALAGGNLGSVIDVGSGDGAVLQELDRRGSATTIDAVEISASGIERINSRHLASLRSVKSFDGYTIPFPDKTFDTAIAIHVLEHVEHERLFLRKWLVSHAGSMLKSLWNIPFVSNGRLSPESLSATSIITITRDFSTCSKLPDFPCSVLRCFRTHFRMNSFLLEVREVRSSTPSGRVCSKLRPPLPPI